MTKKMDSPGHNKSTKRTVPILIPMVAMCLLFYILYFHIIDESQRELLNCISIAGMCISIGGLFFTIWQLILTRKQIKGIEEDNKTIRDEVSKVLNSFNAFLSVADLEKAIQFIYYINDKINCEKYEIAQLRMNDLKTILIEIRTKRNSRKYRTENYGDYITNLDIDVKNINHFFLNNEKNNVDFGKVSDNLMNTLTALTQIKNKLKEDQLWKKY
jgi:uncharacterized protein YpuA (DUF1002 family)